LVRILLVDDEQAIRQVFKSVLELHAFEVETASCAAEAIALLDNGSVYDIVLTDLRMERPLAGFDVVKAAKRCAAKPLAVIITGFPVPPAEWKGAGADALFVKGAEIFDLSGRLESMLKKQPSDAGARTTRKLG